MVYNDLECERNFTAKLLSPRKLFFTFKHTGAITYENEVQLLAIKENNSIWLSLLSFWVF